MQQFSLTANNDFLDQERAGWRAVRLGDLVFPSVPDPQAGHYADDFWPSRHEEYNRLEWDRMDWTAVRDELFAAAGRLRAAEGDDDGSDADGLPVLGQADSDTLMVRRTPSHGTNILSAAHSPVISAAPWVNPVDDRALDLEFDVPSIRERTFLEMWFGYGDPSVEVRRRADGRFDVGYGQHRICAVADYPMPVRDRRLMRLGDAGFLPRGPLADATRIPVIVHD